MGIVGIANEPSLINLWRIGGECEGDDLADRSPLVFVPFSRVFPFFLLEWSGDSGPSVKSLSLVGWKCGHNLLLKQCYSGGTFLLAEQLSWCKELDITI